MSYHLLFCVPFFEKGKVLFCVVHVLINRLGYDTMENIEF